MRLDLPKIRSHTEHNPICPQNHQSTPSYTIQRHHPAWGRRGESICFGRAHATDTQQPSIMFPQQEAQGTNKRTYPDFWPLFVDMVPQTIEGEGKLIFLLNKPINRLRRLHKCNPGALFLLWLLPILSCVDSRRRGVDEEFVLVADPRSVVLGVDRTTPYSTYYYMRTGTY